MAEVGCLKDGHFQNMGIDGNLVGQKINVIKGLGAARTLSVNESGSIVVVQASDVFQLPNITGSDVGTYYTFVYPTSSTTAASVITGGASSLSDDFVPGAVHAICTVAQDSSAFISATPIADADNTLTFDDTTGAGSGMQSGTIIKCTAIIPSAAAANVWFCEGHIITDQTAYTGADVFTAA